MSNDRKQILAANFETVTQAIRQAELSARRQPGSVQLVAVGKLHSIESIRMLAELGQKAFAENFFQEASMKQQELADLDLEWHFIGHIQSNKTRGIAASFDWVHSVDRLKIAKRLSDQRSPDKPPLNVCLQVNLQSEESKFGLAAAEVASLMEQAREFSGIRIRGLMIIPKPEPDYDRQRAVFAQLRQLLEGLNSEGHQLDALSMGMTADLKAAIAEGATHVRIGTALFGPRKPRH